MRGIDTIIENLLTDQKKLNEISEYLSKLLEKRSLFEASQYLALKLLNQKTYTINKNLSAQLEIYKAMKKGIIVPDFDFINNCLSTNYKPDKQPQNFPI
jgi:hypothetical protein